MTQRNEEIVEAVLLLLDLKKPIEFIAGQLELTTAEVHQVIDRHRPGAVPKVQKQLFDE